MHAYMHMHIYTYMYAYTCYIIFTDTGVTLPATKKRILQVAATASGGRQRGGLWADKEAILYNIILYYTIAYYIISYYSILYYDISYHNSIACNVIEAIFRPTDGPPACRWKGRLG